MLSHGWRIAAPICLVISVVTFGCAAPPPGPQGAGSAPPAGTPAAAPSGPKRITAGIRGTAQVLYAKLNIGNAGLGVADVALMVDAGLTARDDQDMLHPELAEGVPTIDNGDWKLFPDGRMETTWKIRERAAWHDGTAFTADDLLFTWQVVSDPALPVFSAPGFESVEDVEAPDPRRVMVRWKQAFIYADQMFSTALAVPMPRHVLERAYADDKLGLPQHPYFTTEFVGTGPFKVKQFVPDSFVALTANDDYVLGRPKIDEIEVRFIPDANTIMANLLSGTVQVVLDPRSLTSAQALQIKDQWTDGHFDFGRSSWVVMFPQQISPNPPAMADVRFRRALMHAINRKEMGELAPIPVQIADSWVGPDWVQYRDVQESIVPHPYDLQRANELLGELGYAKGADEMYQNAAGQKLSVEVRVPGTDINLRSGQTVLDYWKQAGIGGELAVVPAQRTNDREYRSTYPGVELIRPGAAVDTFVNVKSTEIPLAERNWAGTNRQRYASPALDTIIERYLTTIPPSARLDVLRDAVHFVGENLVYMGLIFDPPVLLISNRLKNVPPASLWNGHEWTFD
ncbi:MAG TPA: ABC transporter substrate-binding protein [Chloroflexota bacterium]|nr:ABC transporter substrate-binding protein [Chloroflexota bacterium]